MDAQFIVFDSGNKNDITQSGDNDNNHKKLNKNLFVVDMLKKEIVLFYLTIPITESNWFRFNLQSI